MLDGVSHPPHIHPGFQPLPSLASYPATTLLLQLLQGCYVALCQIHHVNVVPYTCGGSGRRKVCPPQSPPPPLPLTLKLTCPILCGIVITKDIQSLSSPNCHLGQRSGQLPQGPCTSGTPRYPRSIPRYLGDIGHEVVGDALGILADAARSMGTRGVEVPKQHRVPGLWCRSDSGAGAHAVSPSSVHSHLPQRVHSQFSMNE